METERAKAYLETINLELERRQDKLLKEIYDLNSKNISKYGFNFKSCSQTRNVCEHENLRFENLEKIALDSQKITTIINDPREGISRTWVHYTSVNTYAIGHEIHLSEHYPIGSYEHTDFIADWNRVGEQNYLTNKAINNALIYHFFSNFESNFRTMDVFRTFLKMKVPTQIIEKRFRELKENIKPPEFYFKNAKTSIKGEEILDEYSIITTYKQLFCRRCEIYDCQIHGIIGTSENFDVQFASPKDLNLSYNKMREKRSLYRKGRNPPGAEACSMMCYLIQYSDTKTIKLDDFDEALIKRLLKIYKFDPCSIRLFFNKDKYKCYEIYLYLKELVLAPIRNIDKKKSSSHTFHPFIKRKIRSTVIDLIDLEADDLQVEVNLNIDDEDKKNQGEINTNPCYHSHNSEDKSDHKCTSKNCPCFLRGYCEKFCLCDPNICLIRRKGCDCANGCIDSKCVCFAFNLECDPDICKYCFRTDAKNKYRIPSNNCQNCMILFNKKKLCKIGPSTVCDGFGLFNIYPIRKNEFILTYMGEMITWEEADIREKIYLKNRLETYLSTLDDEHVLDARYRGNKSRFINHGKKHANHVFSNGSSYFAFYAKADIPPGTELLFDYEGGGGALREFYSWIVNPNSPKISENASNFFSEFYEKSGRSYVPDSLLSFVSNIDTKVEMPITDLDPYIDLEQESPEKPLIRLKGKVAAKPKISIPEFLEERKYEKTPSTNETAIPIQLDEEDIVIIGSSIPDGNTLIRNSGLLRMRASAPARKMFRKPIKKDENGNREMQTFFTLDSD